MAVDSVSNSMLGRTANPSESESSGLRTHQSLGGAGAATAGQMSSFPEDAAQASDDSAEDYDELQPDPDALVASGRESLDNPAQFIDENMSSSSSAAQRRRSWNAPDQLRRHDGVLFKLERMGSRERYIVTADDPEVKEILRKGIEREAMAADGRQPRLQFSELVFTRRFTTFDRQNPLASQSPFFGFFTLFWLAMVLIFIQVAMHNLRDSGSILGKNQIMKMMFSRDVFVLGITDGVMCLATGMALVLQKIVLRGWIDWARTGWILQNIWQTFYLAAVMGWAYHREWPWTHTIFAVLHGLVFLMKQHSYASYNGYLSGVANRRKVLEIKLAQLERIEPASSQDQNDRNTSLTTALEFTKTPRSLQDEVIVKRRPSMITRTSTNFTKEESDVASVASAITAGVPMTTEQMDTFAGIIKAEIQDLTKELRGKSKDGSNAYPKNLGIRDFFGYVCLPTLVYELEYPRQERINWWYVLEKTTASFGVLCVMMVISQAFIYPPVAKTVQMKETGMPIEQRWREFPFIVSDMLFPLLIEQILTWYLIWECILNVLAEITRFADRGFYGDWWNSTTWDQYARDWNRPVHQFLLRHVYHSSISTFHLSRHAATFATFFLSALVHEMLMAILFRKVRGYLFTMQLLQLPLVSLSRSRLLRGRHVLGNVIFWLGLFVGPSVLTALYLVI